jgi:hypothetical protein
MRRLALATIIILAPNVGVSQLAAQEKALPCPGSGLGSGYLVPSVVAAKAIYRAVASAVVPRNLNKFPIIVAEDKGDHWEMGQTDGAPPPKPEPNTVLITTGGGQFSMDIDKCTGAISNAALVR